MLCMSIRSIFFKNFFKNYLDFPASVFLFSYKGIKEIKSPDYRKIFGRLLAIIQRLLLFPFINTIP